MKMNAYIAGIGMTDFGKFLDTPLSQIGAAAVTAALKDAGMEAGDLEAAWMGNAGAGAMLGQYCVPGQIALRRIGIGQIPVVNVENACASSSTAFQQAAAMVSAGMYDVALACGFEKLYDENKVKSFGVFAGAIDVEQARSVMEGLERSAKQAGSKSDIKEAGSSRSVFMDIYASAARGYMSRYGATPYHFAEVTAKNSIHGHANPHAQFRNIMTPEEVLADPMVSDPLTRSMCSPIGDGAAAIILVSEKKARELGLRDPVRVAASVLVSGWDNAAAGGESIPTYTSRLAYEDAGVGPEDLSCVELHDATSPAELMMYESLGLCDPGEGVKLVEDGVTTVGGRLPVNTSGGLARKGHPVGATGAAQIVELTEQLRGTAEGRQVEGATVAMAENGGAFIGGDVAAITVSILTR